MHIRPLVFIALLALGGPAVARQFTIGKLPEKKGIGSKAIRPTVKAVKSGVSELPPAAKRHAVVIGVDSYADEGVERQLGPSNDARLVARALTSYANFPAAQVTLLASDEPPARQPTRANIAARFASLQAAGGVLVVYFAGQSTEQDGSGYLLPSDAQIGAGHEALAASAFSTEDVADLIGATGAQQAFVILDICRNDPLADGPPRQVLTKAFAKGLGFEGTGVKASAVFFPASWDQGGYAVQGKGYFTSTLVEALRGAAADARGRVTLGALALYLRKQVAEKVDGAYGKEQVPNAYIAGFARERVTLAGASAAVGGSASLTALALEEFTLGEQALQRLDNAAAAELFTKALAKTPDDPQVHRRLAEAYIGLQQYDKAVAALERACELDPLDYESLTRLGYDLYFESGNFVMALQTLDRAYKIRPTTKVLEDIGRCYYNAGVSAFDAGRYEEAADAYARGIPLVPARITVELKVHLARALSRVGAARAVGGDHPAAVEAYQKALEADPASADAHVGLARSYLKLGDTAAAVATYERFKAVNPTVAENVRKEIERAAPGALPPPAP